MNRAAVIIPNWNGRHYLQDCLGSLQRQTCRDFSVYLVDNGSEDGSADFVREHFPDTQLICMQENTGFCRAVNEGIRRSTEPYVILLNNDTVASPGFVEELIAAMERHPGAFACQAKMLQMHAPDRIDDAGDLYCALGWAFARGRGRKKAEYTESDHIFAVCAGACILSREALDLTGLLDEAHFAYLEDIDLCWRAALEGLKCYFAPAAVVLHAGSASSGSKHNAFKARLASRNSVWIIRKNMPVWQVIINLTFLIAGFGIKVIYFARKGLGFEYIKGLAEGLLTSPGVIGTAESGNGFIRFVRCLDIQLQLWVNTLRRIGEHV